MTASLPESRTFAEVRRASWLLLVVAVASLAGGAFGAAHAGPVIAAAPIAVISVGTDPDGSTVVTSGRNAHRLPRSPQRHVGTAAHMGQTIRAPDRQP